MEVKVDWLMISRYLANNQQDRAIIGYQQHRVLADGFARGLVHNGADPLDWSFDQRLYALIMERSFGRGLIYT